MQLVRCIDKKYHHITKGSKGPPLFQGYREIHVGSGNTWHDLLATASHDVLI